MDGNKIFRLHQVDDQLQFFLAGVAADVHRRRRAVVVNDVRLAPEQVVNHAIDGFLVARNDPRREHHRVALFDLGVLVIVHRSARERRHGLALRPTDQHADFFRRKILHLAGMDQQALGNLDVTKILGDLRGVVHRAPGKRHFAPVLPGHLDRQLDAMDRGRETRDEQAPLGVREHFVKLPPHRALARRVAFALDVGRVLEQRQHSGLAVLGEGVQIKQAVVGGRRINFEIAGVNDHAQRSVDGQRHAIHQAVRDLDRADGEGPDLETLARADLAQIGVVQQSVLVKLVFDVGQGELRAPDRHVQLAQDPGQAADVVFVTVGENDALHPLPVFGQVGNIRDNNVDAQQFGLGKHQAAVDDDNIVTPSDGHAVHPELAQAAEGYDVQFSSWHAVD